MSGVPVRPVRRPGLPDALRRLARTPVSAFVLRVTVRAVRWHLDRSRRHGDAGDVPGWVLVTMMSAGLVAVLWVLARDRLTEVLDAAFSSVVPS